MKKHLFFIFYFLFGFIQLYSQNLQNSNWIYGNNIVILQNFNSLGAINFSALPPTNPNSNMLEGCASVSDPLTGQLLFFTDGVRVFSNNSGNITCTNPPPEQSLLGHTSSTQNVVIVPDPDCSSSCYYLFTIDGATGNQAGLYYSKVCQNNVTGNWELVNNFINIPLQDNNNNNIVDNFYNTSEAITVAPHVNGHDYWVVTYVTNIQSNMGTFYSYLITNNSVNIVPQFSLNFAMANNFGMAHTIKISPNSQQIAIGFDNFGLYLGGFNSTNGVINITNTPIANTNNNSVYGLDFSPDSNILYYTNGFLGAISSFNTLNSNITNISNNNALSFYGVQLGQNGNIYCCYQQNNNANCGILEIVNPNNINPMTNFNNINNSQFVGLPQLVPNKCNCPSILFLTSTINDVPNSLIDTRQAQRQIFASNDIFMGGRGAYHAGEFVELNPGFEAFFMSEFVAYVEDCTNNFVYREDNTNNYFQFQNITNYNNEIIIYPNPVNSFLYIESESIIDEIVIFSIDGKMSNKFIFYSENIKIDISNYQSGIYFVKINSNGKNFIKKVVKN